MFNFRIAFGKILMCLAVAGSCTASYYCEVKTGVLNPSGAGDFRFRNNILSTAELGFKESSYHIGISAVYSSFSTSNNDGTKIGFYSLTSQSRTYVLSVLANVYKDFEINEDYSVFCGLGIGFSRYRAFCREDHFGMGSAIFSDAKWLFSGQFMLGIRYDMNEHWAIITDYRCMKIANTTLREHVNVESDLRTPLLHCFEVGLRYTF